MPSRRQPLPVLFFFFTTMDDIDRMIMGEGPIFKGAPKGPGRNAGGKVKTKAKKKAYITGAHGSGSAKQKAKYRTDRANRGKGKK